MPFINDPDFLGSSPFCPALLCQSDSILNPSIVDLSQHFVGADAAVQVAKNVGGQPQTLFQVPDAEWVRVSFDYKSVAKTMEGEDFAVTITSDLDGHSQTLNATTLKQWSVIFTRSFLCRYPFLLYLLLLFSSSPPSPLFGTVVCFPCRPFCTVMPVAFRGPPQLRLHFPTQVLHLCVL